MTRSVSFHLSSHMSNLRNIWAKHVPYLHPCYAVSRASSHELISFLREHRVQMICHNPREMNIVNNAALTIMDTDGKRTRAAANTSGYEHIIRSVKRLPGPGAGAGALVWIHTTVSATGVDETRKMFEYVWANKHILNGIVFNVDNFSNPVLIPSIYSYKIALDYVFRNMILPFQKEYDIVTPAIMMDGRNIITHTDHLIELHEYALSQCQYVWGKSAVRPKLHLMVDRLFDL